MYIYSIFFIYKDKIMIKNAVYNLFYFYELLIIIRIFMTWIPNINWEAQPTKTVRIITDAYLDIFRRFIPPIGGLDFSPIIALIILQVIQTVIVSVL